MLAHHVGELHLAWSGVRVVIRAENGVDKLLTKPAMPLLPRLALFVQKVGGAKHFVR